MKHDGWTAAASQLGFPLPDTAASRLDRYESLLLDRASKEGMIAPGDAPRIRERHVLDCLRAAPLIAPEDRLAYDLGSGAGLPGVVIAIVCPTLGVTLVEVRRHRADFLNEVVTELGLANVTVHAGKAESLVERVDVCLSRAFAPAGTAWEVAERLLGPAGRLIYWAGRSADLADELGQDVAWEPVPPVEGSGSGPLVVIRRAATG